ncbi:MAG: FHA domain-containing protein, partial [Deltaproteobacteria bacterium]|nr:FHA domain-containing protein [Deltaproteobacteria bacterium]
MSVELCTQCNAVLVLGLDPEDAAIQRAAQQLEQPEEAPPVEGYVGSRSWDFLLELAPGASAAARAVAAQGAPAAAPAATAGHGAADQAGPASPAASVAVPSAPAPPAPAVAAVPQAQAHGQVQPQPKLQHYLQPLPAAVLPAPPVAPGAAPGAAAPPTSSPPIPRGLAAVVFDPTGAAGRPAATPSSAQLRAQDGARRQSIPAAVDGYPEGEAGAGPPCPICQVPNPAGVTYCGGCGARLLPPPDGSQRAPSALPASRNLPALPKAKARLVLIRGEGEDGAAFPLRGMEQTVGRTAGSILFPDDEHLSTRHATLFYRNNRLYIRDEGSKNGIFLRIRGPHELSHEDHFLAGEELLRFERLDHAAPLPEPDGTYFYSSP